jgi:hypothetical protein
MHNLRRLSISPLALSLALLLILSGSALWTSERISAQESTTTQPSGSAAAMTHPRLGSRSFGASRPIPAIEPYIRPEFATRMAVLRPAILAAATRHNRPARSGLSNLEFATAMVVILYNENNGWLEDDIEPLRAFTPLYQGLQREVNESPLGGNFSVWPANLRPSVGLELLNQQLPLADGRTISVPVRISGSRIVPIAYQRQEDLYAAITAEISQDGLAVAYLGANLERAIYRANYEGMPISWRTLAAWHNQGLVDPRQIRANPTARDYLRRATAYLPAARAFVRGPVASRYPRMIAE